LASSFEIDSTADEEQAMMNVVINKDEKKFLGLWSSFGEHYKNCDDAVEEDRDME